MHTDHPRQAADASWAQLEQAMERLHAAARSPIGVREFYRQLLVEACDALAATGGAAWQLRNDGRPELIGRELSDPADAELLNRTAHREAVAAALDGGEAVIHAGGERDFDALLCPVRQPAGEGAKPQAVGVIELWMPTGGGPPVRQGWLDFGAALADVAADFHAWEELRRLRGGATLRRQAIDLVRRVSGPRDLKAAAFEAANEGRRLLECDRLSVLVRRGARWRVVAVSGADRVERRTDFTRRSELLAEHVAAWGEPVDYSTQRGVESPAEGREDGDAGLPPPLAAAIEEHVDHSHARRLVCTPIAFAPRLEDEARPRRQQFDVVLVAERFDAAGHDALRAQLVELGELCGPALARAAELDRFPVRTLLAWSDRWTALRQPDKSRRAGAIALGVAAALAALVFIPCDFEVEAPARLSAAVERDVFATASGAVAEVHVKHGQSVAQGDVLVVLSDPELALKLQETRGESASTRKRLEALAVARTDRTLREDGEDQRLPLSAEQRELEEHLASLDRELTLLEARSEALVLRSPHAGTVLTLDVQSLLESRPVERGQVLLTIADATSGWELKADVPQRQIGHVLEAQTEDDAPLTATYRLAGDVAQSYPGHVAEVSAAAPLDADRLQDDAPPVEVRIALDGTPPAAARSGMSANVRIHCGRRSLGYVWLHDVGATLYRWITF